MIYNKTIAPNIKFQKNKTRSGKQKSKYLLNSPPYVEIILTKQPALLSTNSCADPAYKQQ